MGMKPRHIAILVTLALVLSACVPGAVPLLEAPTFRLMSAGSGLVRLDPPGVGSGAAVFRFNLEVFNPNPFGLTLDRIDFDLAVNGRRAASSSFAGGLALAPRGSSPLTLEVAVPLATGLGLLSDLARLIAGEPTTYALQGVVTVDLLGVRQRLPAVTLASGTISQPLVLAAPRVSFSLEQSGLRELSLTRAVVELAFTLENPSPLGYLFRAPELALELAGAAIGTGRAVTESVAAFSTTPVLLRLEFNPLGFGAALPARLAAGGPLNVILSGGFVLELPGVTSRVFSTQRLADGVLRR